MATGRAEPTMRDLMSLIMKNHKSLEEKLEETYVELRTIHSKLSGLEGKIQAIDGRVKSLETNERTMSSKRDVQLAVDHLKDEINESRQRQMRLNNSVIFGIPENDEGVGLVEELLGILAPGDRQKIEFERFGKRNENCRPRPNSNVLGYSIFKEKGAF
jgi:predicted nuclease with TOPRIM domain